MVAGDDVDDEDYEEDEDDEVAQVVLDGAIFPFVFIFDLIMEERFDFLLLFLLVMERWVNGWLMGE